MLHSKSFKWHSHLAVTSVLLTKIFNSLYKNYIYLNDLNSYLWFNPFSLFSIHSLIQIKIKIYINVSTFSIDIKNIVLLLKFTGLFPYNFSSMYQGNFYQDHSWQIKRIQIFSRKSIEIPHRINFWVSILLMLALNISRDEF